MIKTKKMIRRFIKDRGIIKELNIDDQRTLNLNDYQFKTVNELIAKYNKIHPVIDVMTSINIYNTWVVISHEKNIIDEVYKWKRYNLSLNGDILEVADYKDFI